MHTNSCTGPRLITVTNGGEGSTAKAKVRLPKLN